MLGARKRGSILCDIHAIMVYGERAQSELTLLLLHGSCVARMQLWSWYRTAWQRTAKRMVIAWLESNSYPETTKKYSRMYIIHLLCYPYTTI